jgi:hypothetical protein
MTALFRHVGLRELALIWDSGCVSPRKPHLAFEKQFFLDRRKCPSGGAEKEALSWAKFVRFLERASRGDQVSRLA